MKVFLFAVAAGFPIALLCAWAFDLTPEGLIRTLKEPASAPPATTPPATTSADARRADGLSHAESTGASALPTSFTWLSAGVIGLALVVLLGWLYQTRVPDARHLAVLPFRVVGVEAEHTEVFSAGLLETLSSRLTQLGQFQDALWVVPASEIDGPMTPTEARERFGATLVVSGSIQVEANLVRLTLNLVDTETRRQISSQQIDHQRTGHLALQDEATLLLARMLQVRLSDQARQTVTAGGTTNPDANALYLRGRGTLRSAQSADDLDVAIGLFTQSVQEDSLFALAHAGLGEAYWQKYRRTDDVQWVGEALKYSQQALALDDSLAPVWVSLGIIRSGQRHDEAALEALERALQIDPSYADAHRWRADVYRRLGQFERAEQAYQQAIALQPEYWKGYNSLGGLYYATGRYDEAAAQFNHGLRLAPSNPSLLNNVAVVYWELERLDEAVAMFERILRLDPEKASAKRNLATAYFYQGQFDRAAELYAQLVAQRPHDYTLRGYLADAYTWSADAQEQAAPTYRKAITMGRGHLAIRGQDPAVLTSLATHYARLGRADSARVFLRQVEALVDPRSADVTTAFGIGEIYEQLGERERALEWMQSALRRDFGWIQVQYSPWLDALREDPAFAGMRAMLDPDNS
jgi:serine/threonine-protein kinase